MKRILLLLALLALAQPAAAQVVAAQGSPGPVTAPWKFSLVVGGAVVDPRDMSDRSGRLVGAITFVSPQAVTQSGAWGFTCIAGCGSPPAVPDSSAFAFGTINVGPGADVVDDVATNTVAENSSGTPRMSASRIRLMAVTDDTGTRIVVATAGAQTTGNASLSSIDGKTPALVSGREPVDPSGVTSPVSVASLPLPTGAATSALQPTLVAGRTPVDPSGVTSPVSVASLPLPTGAATSALESTIDSDINTLLKPGSTLAGITTVATVTNITTLGTITNAIPLPTLTKGTQAATGASVQELHDAGRTLVTFTADNVVPIVTTDTIVTFSKLVGDTVTAAQTTYAVTSAKILRVTNITWTLVPSSTTVALVRLRLRTLSSGACTVAAGVVVGVWALSSPPGTLAADAGGNVSMSIPFPDGLEFSGATRNLCLSANAIAAAAQTMTITVTGYEY